MKSLKVNDYNAQCLTKSVLQHTTNPQMSHLRGRFKHGLISSKVYGPVLMGKENKLGMPEALWNIPEFQWSKKKES